MNSNKNKDPFFKNVVQKSAIEKPSDDFTMNVMHSIKSMARAQSNQGFQYRNLLNIVMIVFGSLIVLTGTGYYLFMAGISFFPDNNEFNLLPVFENILIYFTQIFESFSISPVTIIILFGVLIIFLLEKFIRKLPPVKNIYFSF